MSQSTSYWSMKFCLAALAMAPGLASAALTHQYSFAADGSDSVGGVNGSVAGEASIAGGVLNLNNTGAARDGLFSMDAAAVAINTYASTSIEIWATPDSALNDGFSALFAAGDNNTTDAGLAANYLALQTHRGDDTSKGAISISDDGDPWTEEDGALGPELNDDAEHHYVLTLDGSTIALYVDGGLTGSNPYPDVNAANLISGIGTTYFQLGDNYVNDQRWAGSVNEFRVYDNALPAGAVAANFAAGPDGQITVPEPSVALLGGLGVLGLLRRRRGS